MLSILHEDVINFVRETFSQLGLVLGTRQYDEVSFGQENIGILKLQMGYFPTSKNVSSEKEKMFCKSVLELVKSRVGIERRFLISFVPVLFVPLKETAKTDQINFYGMFRFAVHSERETPGENLYVGEDKRVYTGFNDFVKSHTLPHNVAVFTPKNGAFSFDNRGQIELSVHVSSKLLETYVTPAVGTLFVASLFGPPIVCTIGGGLASTYGVLRSSAALCDSLQHGQRLLSWPTLGACMIIGANALASSSFLFASAQINLAYARTSLNVLSVICGLMTGKLSLTEIGPELVASLVFLYNVYVPSELGLDERNESFTVALNSLFKLISTYATYDNVLLLRNLTKLVVSRLDTTLALNAGQHFNDLFSFLHYVIVSRAGDSTRDINKWCEIVRRFMNVNWERIVHDLRTVFNFCASFFARETAPLLPLHIQLAVVYTIRRLVLEHVHCSESGSGGGGKPNSGQYFSMFILDEVVKMIFLKTDELYDELVERRRRNAAQSAAARSSTSSPAPDTEDENRSHYYTRLVRFLLTKYDGDNVFERSFARLDEDGVWAALRTLDRTLNACTTSALAEEFAAAMSTDVHRPITSVYEIESPSGLGGRTSVSYVKQRCPQLASAHEENEGRMTDLSANNASGVSTYLFSKVHVDTNLAVVVKHVF